MPLFPPVTDTLRWDDLVRQGRAQLPLVSPDWTDQNVSDPGIALLELISWLVEADSYRSSAVSDRERLLLLSLVGYRPTPARAAHCLVRVVAPTGTVAPRGLAADGDRGGEALPLVLADDVAVTGARIAIVARTEPGAQADNYRSGCHDLTSEHTAGRALLPLGPDPAPGEALLLGLAAPGGLPGGPLDLWFVPGSGTGTPETPADRATHHAATTAWECWNGTAWDALPAVDDTAALTRAGRVRLTLTAVAETTLGDQASGAFAGRLLVWLRCRLAAGRHDAVPTLAGLWSDVGVAVAARPYTTTVELPAGTQVSGVPSPSGPLPRAAVSVVQAHDGTVLKVRFDPPPTDPDPGPVPVVEIPAWVAPTMTTPGLLQADVAVLGVALGLPGEGLQLPHPWCGTPPRLWLITAVEDPMPIPLVADLAHAGPRLLAAMLEPDGLTVRFGDGRWGRTLPQGATVLAAGTWTTLAGVGEVRPPVAVRLPQDARTQGLLGPAAAATSLELMAPLQPGGPAEDLLGLAARAEADLWVHDRLTEAVARRRATSLDDLPLDAVRALGVPERAVTALDVERLALSTPGTALWRARALPQVDPRLPGLKADGCLTVVVVPHLPVAAPEPTPGALAQVRARLARGRTVGTRFFVVGPTYVRIGVQAALVPRPGVRPERAVEQAERALRTFLHPVTGGPNGRGWPFGRAVRRTEILQLLDALPEVDRVEDLVLTRELPDGTTCPDCGDLGLGPTQLALAGSLTLTTRTGASR